MSREKGERVRTADGFYDSCEHGEVGGVARGGRWRNG